MDGLQALIAINATRFFPGIGFPAPDQTRLRDQRPAKRDEIRLPAANHFLHHGDGFQAAHGNDGSIRLFPDFPRPCAEIAFPRRYVDFGSVFRAFVFFSPNAPADLQRIIPCLGKHQRRFHPLGKCQAAFEAVLNPQLDPDGIVRAGMIADGRVNFPVQPQAVFQRAAPRILPPVGKGREELAEKIPVRAMNLDGVKPRLARPARRPAEGLNDILDFPGRHFAVIPAVKGIVGDHRGTDGQLASGFDEARLAAAVIKLYGNFCPPLMSGPGKLLQAGDAGIFGNRIHE